jgi:hypothetical protein
VSETLFKFLLSELATVRIKCKGTQQDGKPCKTILEIARDRLANFFVVDGCKCPKCSTPFVFKKDDGVSQSHVNAFRLLAEAMDKLQSISDRVEVEFVLPRKD